MKLRDATAVFEKYLSQKNLQFTPQREKILRLFLTTEKHLSLDEMALLVKKKHPRIGYSTVFRTLKLLSDSGIAREIDFGDHVVRYEHKLAHEHHDHLICIRCGRFEEAVDPEIEQLQEKLVKKRGYTMVSHRMEIFGLCGNCREKKKE